MHFDVQYEKYVPVQVHLIEETLLWCASSYGRQYKYNVNGWTILSLYFCETYTSTLVHVLQEGNHKFETSKQGYF